MSNVTPFSTAQRRKQVPVTDAILEQIKKVADAEFSAEDIVVYEAVVFNTMPLNKRGSIFEGARATRSLLVEMVEALNSGAESVPLHTLHRQGSEIPVGKVFQATVHDTQMGEAEIHALFYLPRSSADLVEKIDLGILDEVSVGLKSKHLFCSECGFDYFGEEADFFHLWDRTCENGHTVGVDGVHTRLVGMDKWMELSLVSRGAAEKPKILSRAKSLLPKETQERLAASGFVPEATVLFASPTKLKEEAPMADEDKKALTAADLDHITSKLDQLVELLTPKEEEEITAEVEAEESELDALKAQITELQSKVEELSRPKAEDLTPDLPAGGVSASAITDAGTEKHDLRAGAFKTRK
jgi:hypothetical protein